MTSSSPETLYHALRLPLVRFIRRRVPDAQTADDLLQEVFVRVLRHHHALRAEVNATAWVYQIARHVVHDYYRQRRPVVTMDMTALPDIGDGPDDALDHFCCRLDDLLAQLSLSAAEAVRLAVVEELSMPQLAARLGLSVSGAKSRVQRAHAELRALLLACCRFEFDTQGRVVDFTPRCGTCAYSGV